MKVRFKSNTEPCIQYEVKGNPEMRFDNVLERWCECVELEMLGFVATELLTETTHLDNIDAVDVGCELTNDK